MKSQTFPLFQRVIGSVSQYLAKKSLIRQLESLSDHELQDAGIVRGSIPTYVQAIYSDKQPEECGKYSEDRTLPPKHFGDRECAHC